MVCIKLLLFFLFLNSAHLQSNNPFVIYLTKFKNPGQLSDVFEHPINKQYKFGIPRSFIGSHVMPLQREVYFKDNNYQQFWQIVKMWIIKSSDIKQVDNTYNNFFLLEAKKYLCEGWSCCERDADCSIPGNNPRNGELIVEMLGDLDFAMPFRFLINWCEIAWTIYYRDKKNKWDTDVIYRNIRLYCPNSCNSNPCSTKPGVENGNICKVTGLLIDQFECQCSAGMMWDSNALICLNSNPCDQTQYSACDIEGTDECINSGNIGFTCICNEHRMGFDCTQERNACLQNFYTNENNGNYYCNVRYSNKCIPYLGSNFYKCDCSDQFTVNTSIPFDNCLKTVDGCDFLICMNGGLCTSSPDQTESACLCPTNTKGYPMFTGFHCEVSAGVWSDWSTWSKCHPNCGESLYRLRKRYCMNETLECEGFSEEIMPCNKEHKCQKLTLSGMKKSDIVDYPGLILISTLVGFQMLISFFLAQFLILNREVVFPKIIKYCCTPCHNYFKKQI